MKKIIFLFITTILLFVACSEDIFLHDGENGTNGTNGKDGKNGTNGYSVSMFNDATANMTVYYWDRYDRGGNKGLYDSADTIIYRQNNSGIKVIQNIDGSYNIINISGTTETVTGTITNGKNGSDAHNLIFGSKDVYDTSGKIIGFSILTYWDMDNSGETGYGILSEKDVLKFISPTVTNGKDGLNGTNGKDGSNGVDGKSPLFSADIQTVGNNIVYSITLNGVVKTVSVSIPQDGATGATGATGSNGSNGTNGANGQIGLTPSLIVTINEQGTNYFWFADFNGNNIYDDGDEEITSYLVPTNSTEPIITLTLSWDFTAGNLNSYKYTGWVFGGASGFSDGLLYLNNGSATTPTFNSGLDLLSLTFKYASSSARHIKITAIMQDNSEQIIGEFTIYPIANFTNINDYSKYVEYTYYADLDNIPFKNIKRIKFDSSTELKCAVTDFLIKEVIVNFKDNNVN